MSTLMPRNAKLAHVDSAHGREIQGQFALRRRPAFRERPDCQEGSAGDFGEVGQGPLDFFFRSPDRRSSVVPPIGRATVLWRSPDCAIMAYFLCGMFLSSFLGTRRHPRAHGEALCFHMNRCALAR